MKKKVQFKIESSVILVLKYNRNIYFLLGFKVYVFPSKMVYNTSNVIELTCRVSHQNVLNFSNTWIHFYGGIEIRTLRGKVENSLSKLQIPFCDYRDTGTYTCRWSSSSATHSSSSEIYVRGLCESFLCFNYRMNFHSK